MRPFFKKINAGKAAALLVAILILVGSFTPLGDLLPVSVEASAATSDAEGYYDGIDVTLRGDALMEDVRDLITTTHTHQTSYAELSTVFKTSDADPNNPGKILWFYTGTSVSFNGDFGGNTNREHVFPKNGGKAFPEKSAAGSDAHHLRPCDSRLNSTRGSNSFDEVAQTSSNVVAQNGSTSYGNLCYQSGGLFYPGEGYRGATARILMYVIARWGSEYNLTFVDRAGSNKTIGVVSTLMKWHIEEPPTEAEKARNEVVYGIQGNRNPFIDHPEYAEMIFCYDGESYNSKLQNVFETYGSYLEGEIGGNAGSGENTPKPITGITFSSTTANLQAGQSVELQPIVTPSGATGELVWSSSDTSIASVTGGNITAHKAGNVTITVKSAEDASISASVNLTVRASSEPAPSGEIAIDRNSFADSGTYEWVTWSSGSVSGSAYIYGGNKEEIQMNSSKTYQHIVNTTPLSGGIVSITVKLSKGSNPSFELLTSNSPYSTSEKNPTVGTSHGEKTITADGVTWLINTTDEYFTINYKGTGAVYLDSVTITCAESSGTDPEDTTTSGDANTPEETSTVAETNIPEETSTAAETNTLEETSTAAETNTLEETSTAAETNTPEETTSNDEITAAGSTEETNEGDSETESENATLEWEPYIPFEGCKSTVSISVAAMIAIVGAALVKKRK